jgi:hypothetical protein
MNELINYAKERVIFIASVAIDCGLLWIWVIMVSSTHTAIAPYDLEGIDKIAKVAFEWAFALLSFIYIASSTARDVWKIAVRTWIDIIKETKDATQPKS